METGVWESQTRDELKFFRRLPWEKMTTWAIFLLVIYALRSFFAIIIITFVLSYIFKNVTQAICNWAQKEEENDWFRFFVVGGLHLGFILALILICSTLLPTIYDQGNKLIGTFSALISVSEDPQSPARRGWRQKLKESQDRKSKANDKKPADGAGNDPSDKNGEIAGGNTTGNTDSPKAIQAAAPSGDNSDIEAPDPAPPEDALEADEEPVELPTTFRDLVRYRLEEIIFKALGTARAEKLLQDEAVSGLIDAVIEYAANHLPELLGKDAFGHAAVFIESVISFSFSFILSIFFSFMIVKDLPKLEKRTFRLPSGRFRNFCREIVPSLLTFSSVMGRAFQAQTMIAVCNTIFTYFGLLFLEVEARYFLAVIVFFCSYIPILGFILSTIPMCIVALTQQDGGFGLVFGTILMVFVIHLLEGYVLNPLIMGERFQMNALVVIVILLVGKHFFGLWGLLLGVPVCHYLFRYAIQGHEEPSIRHSGIWRSLYPKQAEADDALEMNEPSPEKTDSPSDT